MQWTWRAALRYLTHVVRFIWRRQIADAERNSVLSCSVFNGKDIIFRVGDICIRLKGYWCFANNCRRPEGKFCSSECHFAIEELAQKQSEMTWNEFPASYKPKRGVTSKPDGLGFLVGAALIGSRNDVTLVRFELVFSSLQLRNVQKTTSTWCKFKLASWSFIYSALWSFVAASNFSFTFNFAASTWSSADFRSKFQSVTRHQEK